MSARRATGEDWSEGLALARAWLAEEEPALDDLRAAAAEHPDRFEPVLRNFEAVLREEAADVVEVVGWLRETAPGLAARHADVERLARCVLGRVGSGERGPGNREEVEVDEASANVIELADQDWRRVARRHRLRGEGADGDPGPLQHPREWLSEFLGVEVIGATKLGRRGERWQLRVRHRGEELTIDLGGNREVLRGDALRATMLGAIGEVPQVARGDMARFAACVGHVAELVDSVMSPEEETREWLVSFYGDPSAKLCECDPDGGAALRELLDDRDPLSFTAPDGRLYLRLPHLERHVLLARNRPIHARELGARLGALGFTREQVSARDGSRVLKARYWVSPPGFDPRS